MSEAEPFSIVFRDDHIAVIDKGSDLVVHPAPSYEGETLVEMLGDMLGGGDDPERPGIVHRLDRGTSGLMVVARDDASHAALQEAIRRRDMTRTTRHSPRAASAPAPARSTPRSAVPRANGTAWPSTEPLRAKPGPISRSSRAFGAGP